MSNSCATILSQYALSINRCFGLIAQKEYSDKLINMKGNEFERCLVEVMATVAEQKGFKHKPLAERAWPDRKDPGTKWRKIRNGSDPRGLRVEDAYDLAVAMDVSFIEICGIAQGRLMQSEMGQLAIQNAEKKELPESEDAYTSKTPTFSRVSKSQSEIDAG